MTTPLPRRLAYVPLGAVRPAARNPKQHNRAGILASIERFALGEVPLVDDRTGRLVAGHGRIEALVTMREEGQRPPEGVVVDDDGEWLVPVIRGWSSRTDTDAEAYTVASNHLSESGGWYQRGLAELVEDIATEDPGLLDAIGFTADDIDQLLRRTDTDPDGGTPQAPGQDAPPAEEPHQDDVDGPTAVACPGCGTVIPLRV
ncbi:hypothetical protein ABN028_19795 [Actinopolymorpha sp. B17G11]|uniref:hypothetical protein n=1 Tax=Actinopolymorpha sp. B17G11 TaxID=3160861 RepID=UPI0032E4A82F